MSERKRLPIVQPWRITYEGVCDDYAQSVFFTGNGCLGVRGFPAWQSKTDPQQHAIFRAGLFESIKPKITDMVQLPDALTMLPDETPPEAFAQELDLKRGVLRHAFAGTRVSAALERMVSMADTQLICQRLTLTAREDGTYGVRAIADSRVVNLPIHDDQAIISTETIPLLALDAITADGFRLHASRSGHRIEYKWTLTPSKPCQKDVSIEDGQCVTVFSVRLHKDEAFTVELHARVLVKGEAPHEPSADPWREHERAWDALWADCDVELKGDDCLQGALRYNIYQMLCSNAANDPTVSIGARGLTHGRYKGNTFWDTDIFLFPFYLWQRPTAARNLARYRIDRLPDAERLAASQNLEGARYPWMCSDTGAEQCESWDIGQCETHITADVSYALSRYGEVTGDTALMESAKPVFAQTARYWVSRLTYEPDKDKYSLFFVKGPDEYCGAAINNTYSCYLARHNLRLGADALGGDEAKSLRAVADRVTILYDQERDLYLQDEAFERLEPAPFMRNGASPMYKQVCFDRMQRYRVLKQADLVQLMTMFPNDFSQAQKENVFSAYEPLTLHDSTLSYGIHALLAFRLKRYDKAMEYLRRSAYLDLYDGMSNTGHEGVHVAALGATWQAVVYGMVGLWSDGGHLTAAPCLPEGIERVSLRVWHHGRRYRVTATRDGARAEEE